jgi:hypothetical protein
MRQKQLIESYIRLLVERELKQAVLSGDRTAEWGSDDHVSDLESRCADAMYWRDKYPKGSEKRAHYRNVYNHLKKELQSAKKKSQINEKQRGKR